MPHPTEHRPVPPEPPQAQGFQADEVVWALGFRPFFLLLPPWFCLSMLAWLAVLAGTPQLAPTDPLGWHAHEMVLGFGGALLSGFLLTSARNWTGQATAHGRLLRALVSLWIIGRLAAWGGLGGVGAAADVGLLLGVAWAIGRPILRRRQWRNGGFPLLLLTLAAADLGVHAGGTALLAGRAAGLVVLAWFLVAFGGRITPLFTRNALKPQPVRASGLYDRVAVGSLAPVLALTVLAPSQPVLTAPLGACLVVAGLLNLGRLWGWRSWATLDTPLLWTLHGGFAAVGAALSWRGAALLTGASVLPSTHLLTVGGLAAMALCMMTRVTLGHTGRPLSPPLLLNLALVMVPIAAVLRVAGAVAQGPLADGLLRGGGGMLVLAMGVFGVVTGPWLLARRVDGKPG